MRIKRALFSPDKMPQVKSYDGTFQAIRALNVHEFLKIRMSSQNSCKMKAFSRFLLNDLI